MSETSQPLIEPVILDARRKLREGREKIRARHDEGAGGPQVCAQITDLFDRIILEIWNEAIKHHPDTVDGSRLALIAHGGYGRCDLAPYSDVDLMLVCTGKIGKSVQQVASELSRNIVDAGLQLGFSVRSPTEACRLAWKDPVIFSSLTESRLLAGSLQVYESFFAALRRGTKRRRAKLIDAVQEARRQERAKWGETNYLLRPNVKRSRGGLRDLQLIRWIGFACDGETELDRLVKLGRLPAEDHRRIRQAHAFLLRLRNELHFSAGRSQDVLDRPTQMRIAAKWGYQPQEARLAVEMFMQDYFEHTRNVRYASAYVYAVSQRASFFSRLLERLVSRRIDDAIRIGPYSVWVKASRLPEFAGNLTDVLRLMDVASRHSRRILHPTWQAIRLAMIHRPPGEPDAAAVRSFLSLMSRPGRLPDLLRHLHELRVLEQFIPAMKRARGLLQFNEYHKYTVDRHCIRAVEAATQFEFKQGPARERYRQLSDKLMLHLSLLIHDLGKGFEEDHSTVGKQIAAETAQVLRLDEQTSETLQWLVHKHLIMHHAAFRHDLNDPQIIAKFAAEVGTTERLELLTLMSLADLTAVGPDVLTDWKEDLIYELCDRTRAYLETGKLPGEPSPQSLRRRAEIRQQLETLGASDRCLAMLDELPEAAIERASPTFIAELIRDALDSDPPAIALCRGRFDAGRGATEYTVVMQQKDQPIGTFAKATGALAACGLSILKAEISTLSNDWIWDTFLVEDQGTTANHDEHIREIGERVARMMSSSKPVPTHRKVWSSLSQSEASKIKLQPARVSFDNETMDRYTILLLFAYDRPGLLASVSAVLASLKIVLHFAKIDTHLDQAVDVFYISELDNTKITSPARLSQIRFALLAAADHTNE